MFTLYWGVVWSHSFLCPSLPVKMTIPHLLPRLIRQSWTSLEPLTWNFSTHRFPTARMLIGDIYHIFSVELSRPCFRSEYSSRE